VVRHADGGAREAVRLPGARLRPGHVPSARLPEVRLPEVRLLEVRLPEVRLRTPMFGYSDAPVIMEGTFDRFRRNPIGSGSPFTMNGT
jgi:hypothetical protein